MPIVSIKPRMGQTAPLCQWLYHPSGLLIPLPQPQPQAQPQPKPQCLPQLQPQPQPDTHLTESLAAVVAQLKKNLGLPHSDTSNLTITPSSTPIIPSLPAPFNPSAESPINLSLQTPICLSLGAPTKSPADTLISLSSETPILPSEILHKHRRLLAPQDLSDAKGQSISAQAASLHTALLATMPSQQQSRRALRRMRTSATNSATTSTPNPPLNAYILFCNDWRDIYRAEYPDVSTRALATILGAVWKALPADCKEHYVHLASEARSLFDQQHPGFESVRRPKRSSSSRMFVNLTKDDIEARIYGRSGSPNDN